jgi:hypothetical protein
MKMEGNVAQMERRETCIGGKARGKEIIIETET